MNFITERNEEVMEGGKNKMKERNEMKERRGGMKNWREAKTMIYFL